MIQILVFNLCNILMSEKSASLTVPVYLSGFFIVMNIYVHYKEQICKHPGSIVTLIAHKNLVVR